MLSQLPSHGQTVELTRETRVIEVPAGTEALMERGTPVRIVQELGGDFTVRTRDGSMYRIDGSDADTLGRQPREDAVALAGDPNGPLSDDEIEGQLKKCFDPEIPVNILDLGLIYEAITEQLPEGGHRISIKMTLTAPGCGMGEVLVVDVRRKLERLPQVREAKVDLVFDPPWSASMMSEVARLQTGLM